MPDLTHGPADRLWAFSLSVYGRPGAAEACLLLQDRHGLDVNLGLFALWLGAGGQRLDDATLAAARTAVEEWHRAAVVPLRNVRRFLKPLAGDAAVAALRNAVKATELEAERLEQRRLAALPPPAIRSPEAADLPRTNLLRLLPTDLDDESHQAVALLAGLAASAVPGHEV